MIHQDFLPKKRSSALSVMELLVTLGIMAVLLVCLFTGIRSVQTKMKQATCLSNMRTIGMAVLTYANENDLKYPIADNGAWDVPMTPYLDGDPSNANPVMKCPSDERPLIINGGHFSRSYSFNGNLPARTINNQEPARTIMLAEWYTGNSGPGGATHNYQYSPEFSVVEYNLEGLPAQYHKTVSNFIFGDGHGESYAPRATIVPNSFWTMR